MRSPVGRGALFSAPGHREVGREVDDCRHLTVDAVRRGAAPDGVTWTFARPPVEGLAFEMDVRGVPVERVIG